MATPQITDKKYLRPSIFRLSIKWQLSTVFKLKFEINPKQTKHKYFDRCSLHHPGAYWMRDAVLLCDKSD